MKNSKILFLMGMAASLALTACGGQASSSEESSSTSSSTSSSSSSSSSTPVEELTTLEAIAKVKTVHNYKLGISTYLEFTPEDVYTNNLYNVDDLAIYQDYYDGYTGYIKQENQGYVDFIQAGSNILPDEFYCTRSDAGISTVCDFAAENLFGGELEETEDDVYKITDEYSIAVACNLTGYMDSAWLIAPDALTTHYSNEKKALIVDVPFQVAYIDPEKGETIENGYCTLSIGDIGTTVNEAVSEYAKNPTSHYETRTAWTEREERAFAESFKMVPPFPFDASYAFELTMDHDYKGDYFLVTDYASGDLSLTYAAQLVAEGFAANGEGAYTKQSYDASKNQLTTWTIELNFSDPSEEYNGHTIGFYYPAGIFTAIMRVKIETVMPVEIDTVKAFNEYLTSKGLNDYVPLLPFAEGTEISGFLDKSATQDYYRFYTGTSFFKVKTLQYADMVKAIDDYLALLADYGFSDVDAFLGTIVAHSEVGNSMIRMTDPSAYTEDTYPGYFEMQYQVYTDSPKHEDTPIPPVGPGAEFDLSKYGKIVFEDTTPDAVPEYLDVTFNADGTGESTSSYTNFVGATSTMVHSFEWKLESKGNHEFDAVLSNVELVSQSGNATHYRVDNVTSFVLKLNEDESEMVSLTLTAHNSMLESTRVFAYER